MAEPVFRRRRHRSPLVPPWIRPYYRRFKARSTPLSSNPPRIKGRVDRPSQNRSSRPETEMRAQPSPEIRKRLSPAPPPLPSPRMQAAAMENPASLLLRGPEMRLVPDLGNRPLPPMDFAGSAEGINGFGFPVQERPAAWKPPDLRELIRRKTKPPPPTLSTGPMEGPVKEQVRFIPNNACMQDVFSSDRRIWAPGEIRPLVRPVHEARGHPSPWFAPRIVTGPSIIQPGQLSERGMMPRGPASQMHRVVGPMEELEDPGRARPSLGQE